MCRLGYYRFRDRFRIRTHLIPLFAIFVSVSNSAHAISSGRSAVLYVSSAGDDLADGNTPASALYTLERARDAARSTGSNVTIYIIGILPRSSPLRLDARDKGDVITAAPGNRAEMRAIGNADIGILLTNVKNVTVSNVTISGFKSDGIRVSNSSNVTILNNTIKNTLSTAWSQGAIHLTGSVPGALIKGNTIKGADYAGIIVDTTFTSDISNIVIAKNIVTDTCRKIVDCGAIYVNDRSRKSSNILIEHNIVTGFGPDNVLGRGIYLDDWASHTMVHNNRISGPGTYAFMIHGGNHNTISGNLVDMKDIGRVLLYQPAANQPWFTMVNNVIRDNTFLNYPLASIDLQLNRRSLDKAALPILRNNRFCITGLCGTSG
jgi:parallel beta-helix repeat protein